MRLKYDFELIEMDGSTIAVPVGNCSEDFHGVIRLNDTAAFIFNLLKDETTEADIVNALEKEYCASIRLLEEDVHKYIAAFNEKGLLT